MDVGTGLQLIVSVSRKRTMLFFMYRIIQNMTWLKLDIYRQIFSQWYYMMNFRVLMWCENLLQKWGAVNKFLQLPWDAWLILLIDNIDNINKPWLFQATKFGIPWYIMWHHTIVLKWLPSGAIAKQQFGVKFESSFFYTCFVKFDNLRITTYKTLDCLYLISRI